MSQDQNQNSEEILAKLASTPKEQIVSNAKLKAQEMLSGSESILSKYLGIPAEEFSVNDFQFVQEITLLRLKEIFESIPTENPEGLAILEPIIIFWNTVNSEISNYKKD